MLYSLKEQLLSKGKTYFYLFHIVFVDRIFILLVWHVAVARCSNQDVSFLKQTQSYYNKLNYSLGQER